MVSLELDRSVKIETKDMIIESEDAQIDVTSTGYCYEFKIVAYQTKITQKEFSVPSPELYIENLATLQVVMSKLDNLVEINGVFDLEIRVKVDDVNSWAVIGYGESGDPCILRFENG